MKYCVYLTIYRGNKLPPFYLGSSSTGSVKNGYRGSCASKLYQDIWQQEIQENPQLFQTKILSTHKTRKEAYSREKILLEKMQCTKNPLYINQPKNWKVGQEIATKKVKGKSWEEILGEEKANKRKREMSVFSKKIWSDPTYKNQMREHAKNNWKDPKMVAKMLDRKPTNKYKEAAQKRWADPKLREKMINSMKGVKKKSKSSSFRERI